MKRSHVLPLALAAFAGIFAAHASGCAAASKAPTQASPGGEPTADESSSSSGEGSGSGAGGSSPSPRSDTSPAPAGTGTAAAVVSAGAGTMDGVKFGMSRNDVFRVYNEAGGIIDKDYDAVLRKMQPGVQMKATEAERDNVKRGFERSVIEFKDLPTGLDSTGLRTEYSYKNRESITTLDRPGKRRIFFFIGDRLWKVYDEVKLGGAAGLGGTYKEALVKLGAQFGGAGKAVTGAPFPTTEWQDATTHMRAVDRSSEKVVGVVLEEKSTLANLPQLRSAKADDPFALDPSISAVTKGGISDPNAGGAPTATASATGKVKPPKKK